MTIGDAAARDGGGADDPDRPRRLLARHDFGVAHRLETAICSASRYEIDVTA
jgi:hypothetical protein